LGDGRYHPANAVSFYFVKESWCETGWLFIYDV
jgi:hypothetical protein